MDSTVCICLDNDMIVHGVAWIFSNLSGSGSGRLPRPRKSSSPCQGALSGRQTSVRKFGLQVTFPDKLDEETAKARELSNKLSGKWTWSKPPGFDSPFATASGWSSQGVAQQLPMLKKGTFDLQNAVPPFVFQDSVHRATCWKLFNFFPRWNRACRPTLKVCEPVKQKRACWLRVQTEEGLIGNTMLLCYTVCWCNTQVDFSFSSSGQFFFPFTEVVGLGGTAGHPCKIELLSFWVFLADSQKLTTAGVVSFRIRKSVGMFWWHSWEWQLHTSWIFIVILANMGKTSFHREQLDLLHTRWTMTGCSCLPQASSTAPKVAC